MPGNVNTTNYGVNHSGDEDLSLTSVACISAGNCTVFGNYDANAADNDVPFVLTESNASWAQAVEAPLPSDASPAYGGVARFGRSHARRPAHVPRSARTRPPAEARPRSCSLNRVAVGLRAL